MTLNRIGVVAALATFLGVWIGHVTVRKVEYRAPDLRVPMLMRRDHRAGFGSCGIVEQQPLRFGRVRHPGHDGAI